VNADGSAANVVVDCHDTHPAARRDRDLPVVVLRSAGPGERGLGHRGGTGWRARERQRGDLTRSRAHPALPRDRRAPEGRSPLHHDHGLAGPGADAREPGRGPSQVLPPLQAGGEGHRRRALARREPTAPDRRHHGSRCFGRQGSGDHVSNGFPGRTRRTRTEPSCCLGDPAGSGARVRAGAGDARRAAHGHGSPGPPHRVCRVPGEARGGAAGALPLAAGGVRGGCTRGRPRPPPRPRREEQGAGREASVHAGRRRAPWTGEPPGSAATR